MSHLVKWCGGPTNILPRFSQVKPWRKSCDIYSMVFSLTNDIGNRSYIPFWDGYTLGLEVLCYRLGGFSMQVLVMVTKHLLLMDQ